MDHNFTKQLQDRLNTPDSDRDYDKGALFLLQLSNNKIMYRNIMMNPKRHADFIVPQIEKYLKFRLQDLTHEEVADMQTKVDAINKEHNLEEKKEQKDFKSGIRQDYDSLPDEIQAVYKENLDIMHKMRELHLKIRTLSAENVTCPDSERYS